MALCLCAEIQTVQTRHRLLVVPHENEAKKTTTTGVLAARVLSNSAVKVVSGKGGVGIIDGGDVDVAHALLLFPAPEAESIIDVVAAFRAHGDPPLTLVVPDGTWSETQKMRRRVPGLAALRPVSLPPGPPTIYRLRHEPKSGGLATLEAIARAFTVLEGGDDDAAKAHVAAVDAALMSTFKRFVERTLWMRGAIGDHELEYGLPAAAKRHSPRGGLPPTS
jgi:DTW domain-containing protein YfiP